MNYTHDRAIIFLSGGYCDKAGIDPATSTDATSVTTTINHGHVCDV